MTPSIMTRWAKNSAEAFQVLVLWSIVLLDAMKKEISSLPVEKQEQSKQDYADILIKFHELLDRAAKF